MNPTAAPAGPTTAPAAPVTPAPVTSPTRGVRGGIGGASGAGPSGWDVGVGLAFVTGASFAAGYALRHRRRARPGTR